MNDNYKTAKKIVGPNNTQRFFEGDRVFHWFAGKGTVTRIKNKTLVRVKWDDARRGGAYGKHLHKI